MAIQPENLELATASKGAIPPRIEPGKHGGARSVLFAQVGTALTIVAGTPVAYNATLEGWAVWDPNTGASSAANEVQTMTDTGTVTGGTFTLTFDGETTAAIVHNAAAATIEAALDLLSTVVTAGDISVSGGALPTTDVVFTFDGTPFLSADIPLLVVDDSLLTGTTPAYVISQTTAGTPGTGAPAGEIRGFVYPDSIDLLTAGETFGVVMRKGAIHLGDVVLPTTGAPTQAQLEAELRNEQLGQKGILVDGLSGIL